MSDPVAGKVIDPARKYATTGTGSGSWICKFCDKVTHGGVNRMKQHLAGGYTAVKACTKAPDEVREEVRLFILNKAEAARATIEMMQPRSFPQQNDCYDYEEEDHLQPNNCNGQGSCPNKRKHKGSMDRYVAPTPPDVLKGRKDIINFLVNSPKGSVFIKSVDVSEVVKDSNLMFGMLDRMVEEVGESNVFQVVTDNASNYVKAGKLLMAKRPHLYWTPCAAHCINLMLEDIGQLPRVKTAIKNCIFMNGYIYNHTSLVNMMRRFTHQCNLHRPAVTRFATSFITLAQYHQQKNNLRTLVTSQDWNDSKWPKETGAKKVRQLILQDSFWRNVLYALKLVGPLVRVLRLVDGEKSPPMGYIYEAMDRAKETIAKTFFNREDEYKQAFDIIDERWNCQLHQP